MCRRASSSGDNSLPVNTTTGKSLSVGISRRRSRTSNPDISGRRRSSTTQSKVSSLTELKRFTAGRRDRYVDILVAQQFANAELLGGIVFHHQQPLAAWRRVFLDARQRRLNLFRRRRFGDECKCAARQAMVPILIERQHLHGNMTRRGILLQMIEHRPAQHVGQEDIQRDRRRMEFAGQRQRFRAAQSPPAP